MTKRRVIAYVDGFNFYYRRLRNKPYRWLDLCKFFEQFFPDDKLVQVRYFTARVGGKFDPSKPLRQQAYLKALQTLPRVSITEGKFLTTQVQYRLAEPLQDADGNVRHSAKVWKLDEKGSDVNLGSYLLNEAWEDKYDVAIVVTNDSDLAVPIQMAVKRGKTVIVLHSTAIPLDHSRPVHQAVCTFMTHTSATLSFQMSSDWTMGRSLPSLTVFRV
jgi:hypothetical protein